MLQAALLVLLALQERPDVKVVAVRPDRTQVRAGEVFHVAVEVEIPGKWYIYPAGKAGLGKPTDFVFEGAEAAGPVLQPAPRVHKDEVLGDYGCHEGRVTFTVPLRLLPGTRPGPADVKGKIDYQLCSDVCLQKSAALSFRVGVLEGGEHGFLGLILLGALGGLVSLVMPCTYPLIPITLTYFLKQAAGSRAHGMALSTSYAAGIVATFTGLGFLMSVLLGAGGARIFASDPWVNVSVGALFLGFTGSLFGWYEIRLPGASSAAGPQRGAGGAFLLGLLFAVVSFTCTIPIAATILSLAAGQHRFAALAAMLSYSATMALPFFVMGIFPGMIKEVPKSGGWLEAVKVSMAWVELGLAVFYFSKADQTWEIGVLNRVVVAGLWAACGAAAAVYLWRSRRGAARAVFAALFLAFGATLAAGATGRTLGILEIILPPPALHGTTLAEAVREAKARNLPLFAEFTGVT